MSGHFAESSAVSLRDKIIGLGNQSIRKSYYPQLQQRLEDLERSKLQLEERSLVLQRMLENLERTRQRLADSEARYRMLVENISDAIFSLDNQGIITYISPVVQTLCGLSAEALVGSSFTESFEESDGISPTPIGEDCQQPFEVQILDREGGLHYLRVSLRPRLEDGVFVGINGVLSDITDRKLSEKALHRLNRELRAISTCHDVLMRATGEVTLLNDICSIVCDQAEYRMAWVGYAEHDDLKSVRPVAWAGSEDSFLETAQVVWSDTDRGRGPTGIALRTGKTSYIQDFATDDCILPLRDEVQKRQFRSAIALPLKDEQGAVFGAFVIHSQSPNAFTQEEIRLLEELAGDMAFGIAVLRGRIERKCAEDEICRLNTKLEERVRQRTAELETANRELEAFSYTVSHDLRAPLRAIDGFSKMLLEENESRLDGGSKECIHRIRTGATHMSQLIEDILTLSHISRAEMRFEKVNMSALAEEIYSDLSHREPERLISVAIHAGVEAMGDPRFLRIALENLLGNAWKFTSRTQNAAIEFGISNDQGRDIYFVRDNGAGFDMRYSNQLFEAFQRLHNNSQFPGNGIGLATVHKVIQHHRGTIWAESTEGCGAAFFFTLGTTNTGKGTPS